MSNTSNEATYTTDSTAQQLQIEVRKEIEILGDTLLAVKMQDGSIYLPLRALCESLGLDRVSQVRRIKRDEVMSEDLQEIVVETEKGLRESQFLRLETVPFWLAGITVVKVKPELREKLRHYKRWVIRTVYEAFLEELNPKNEMEEPKATQSLLNLRELGLALVQLAEEQLALEQEQSLLSNRQNLLEKEQTKTSQDVVQLQQRVNRASQIVGRMLNRIERLEERTSSGQLTEEQAAEISLAVKQVASELARREQSEANPYQRVFVALYQRYSVTGYKKLTHDQYADAMNWLNEWYETLLQPTATTSSDGE